MDNSFQPNDMFALPMEAISTLEALPESNTRGWATRQDWVRHRVTLEKLYENHQLAEIMAIMERQHKFKATSVRSFQYFLEDS